MDEKRYAILIGINDYKTQKLNFCDKDVLLLSQRLINNCQFEVDNVIPIISSNESPITDVHGAFLDSIAEIRNRFNPNIDSLHFYFSGHGKFESETILEFHEKHVKVREILDALTSLAPKNTIVILDACHSGFGIEVKDSAEGIAMTQYYNQRYIGKADGFYFMCSCKQDEKSRAFKRYNNSVYTKYFCEAIDNGNLYDKETRSISLMDIHQYAAKRISINGEYQQTPFLQTQANGYYPFAFIDRDAVITNCKISIEQTNDKNEIAAFFLRSQLNMTDEFRRDLSQFMSELIFNLFEHNFAKSVSISLSENKIEIVDDSSISYNPFEAKISDQGLGVVTYKTFFKKYDGRFQAEYFAGHPNVIKLAFDASIFQVATDNPCYIELPDFMPILTRNLNQYDFDDSCSEIVFDISKTATPLSLFPKLFDYLLYRTRDKKPLIILKMHKNDMLREDVRNIIDRNYSSARIMLI